MQIHLITGHRTVTSSTEPVAIYCGACADAANTARDKALASGEFQVVEQHVVQRGVLRYASDEAIAAYNTPKDQTSTEVLNAADVIENKEDLADLRADSDPAPKAHRKKN